VVNGVSHSTSLSDPRLHVNRHARDTVKPRRLHSITELSGNLSLGVNNADIGTAECALLTRMFYCKVGDDFVAPPPVDQGRFTERLATFRRELLRRVRMPTKSTLQEIVDSYTGRKRSIYENALRGLTEIGLSRNDARSVMFVKMELVDPEKAPRCIQPRDPKYNLALGRYIKPAEHRIYDAIRRVFGDGPTVMKGYNVSEIGAIARGKWRSFANPVAIGLDATKFDMHVSPSALAWEHGVYRELFKGDRELKRLLRWQMNNKGAAYCADGSLTYSVRGKRFSGDMNTGLGNCLLMCAMVYAYAESRGVQIKLLNNGDDCVVIMERTDMVAFNTGLDEWFMDMGFRMVAEAPVFELHQIEFCQMHPIEIGEECRMVRNIATALRKDTLTVHNVGNAAIREKWCTAVGTCGLWLTGGVPIVQDFYQAYQRIGCMRQSKILNDPTFATGMRLMAKGMLEHHREPDAWTRVQVFEAWGVTPDEQVQLEQHYRTYQLDSSVTRDDVTNYNPLLDTVLP
jgi:hypothetical protein